MISRIILKIHGDYNKRLGAYKITHILEIMVLKLALEEYID